LIHCESKKQENSELKSILSLRDADNYLPVMYAYTQENLVFLSILGLNQNIGSYRAKNRL
jgi:hypothetical protein